MKKRIPPMDLSWLVIESRATPMNVGGLLTFELPEDAPADYLATLADKLRSQRRYGAPWNLKVAPGLAGKLPMPRWVEDNNLDLDYHFRHSALPAPGGERELGVLVSRLHSAPLDLDRPLWEVHLIEGLAPNRFAIYLKIHHAVVDGISIMRYMLGMMTTEAGIAEPKAIWTNGAVEDDTPKAPVVVRVARTLVAVPAVIWGLSKMVGGLIFDKALVAPYASPRSVLSEKITQQRRFATQQIPMGPLKQAAEATGGTLNDMVLWLCSTTLTRFMALNGHLPEKSLTAAVPASLRDEKDRSVGTNIATLLTSLATDEVDPKARLEKIIASSSAAKEHMRAASPAARYAFSVSAATGVALGGKTKLDRLLPPMFSLVVSNVPGPSRPMYLDGAKLEAIYPISLLMRGGALNITVVSTGDKLNFGFIGARDTLPHLQRLSGLLLEAADQLNQLAGISPEAARDGDAVEVR